MSHLNSTLTLYRVGDVVPDEKNNQTRQLSEPVYILLIAKVLTAQYSFIAFYFKYLYYFSEDMFTEDMFSKEKICLLEENKKKRK